MAQISPQPPDKDSKQDDDNKVDPPSSIQDAETAHTLVSVEVSLLVRRLCWVAIVLLHFLVGVYFYGYAEVYRYLKNHEDAIGPFDSLESSIKRFDLPVRAASYAIAISHGLAVGNAVLSSLVSRELVLSLPPRKGRRLQLRERGSAFASAVLTSFKQQLPRPRWWVASRLIAPFRNLMNRFVGAFQDFVTKNEMDMLQLTNAIEVSLQIFQANKLSNLVAKVWVNRMMALVVVANCWCLPIIHFWYRKRSPRSERLIKHVVDAVVDTVYGVLIPFAIFYPYYRDVNLSYGYFSYRFYYMDTWRINITAEANQVFVTSAVDFVSKMTPGVMLFHALWSIQTLVSGNHHHKAPGTAPARFVVASPGAGIVPSGKSSSATEKPGISLSPTATKKWKRYLDVGLCCAGLLVFVLHIHASAIAYSSQDRGCLLELRPWASRKYICVVLEVSCSQRGIAGQKAEIEAPLANVEPRSLQKLILSHCSELEIPERFQTLSALGTLKIHNSTIVEWGEDASVTAAAHPSLGWLIITLSNMSRIPQGLLAKEGPLVEINLCGTNLTHLPENVTEEWTNALKFGLELSPGVTEVPRSILALPFFSMSLSMDNITFIGDDVFVDQPYWVLSLAYNPISEIPASVMALPKLQTLDIRATLVSDLPVELLDASSQEESASGDSSSTKEPLYVEAADTPLCEKLIQEAATEGWDLYAVPVGSILVSCIDDGSGPFSYPLSDEIEWRSVNRE